MKTLTLSDLDAEIIADAIRLKHSVLIAAILAKPEEPAAQPAAPAAPPAAPPVPKYGVKADGTPRKPPGRPRKKR